MLRRESDPAPYGARHVHESMNRALDQALDPAERDSLHAHLEQTPADAELWQQMRRVDRLIRSARTVSAPNDFSARVMAILAASKKDSRPENPQHDFRTSLSVAVALIVAVCAAVPLLGGSLLLLMRLFSSGNAAQVIGLLRAQWLLLQTSLNGLWMTLVSNQSTQVLAVASLSAVALCGWLVRLLLLRTPDVTYRIPVSFVASSSM